MYKIQFFLYQISVLWGKIFKDTSSFSQTCEFYSFLL